MTVSSAQPAVGVRAGRVVAAFLALLALAVAGLIGPRAAQAQDPGPTPPEQLQPDPRPSGEKEGDDPAPSPPAQPGTRRALSNETTLSRAAYVVRAVWARRKPAAGAGRVMRLREYTPHGSDEVVLALRETTVENGSVWVEVRLPMRPNGTTAWVPRTALGAYRVIVKHLVINRRRLRATLYDGQGRAIWTAPVGVGQRQWPTPSGRFYARELLFPTGRARRVYGPVAFGTSAYSNVLDGEEWAGGQIGVHGTGRPQLLPGRVSHGCVRVRNDRIRRLRRLMPIGTPIRIL